MRKTGGFRLTQKLLDNGVRSHFSVNFRSLWGWSARVTLSHFLGHFNADAPFLLTVGSFLAFGRTIELFAYGHVWKLFCLQLSLFAYNLSSLLRVGVFFCLQWVSASYE